MLKSELAGWLAARYALPAQDADKIVNTVLDTIVASLGLGRRVELRGFGAFSVKTKPPRASHNPRTGAPILIDEKRHLYFRAGKEMRQRLNSS
jgi:integration host factor subunit beta